MSCKCQKCNRLYDYDLLVPDYVWLEIKPEDKDGDAGLLCPECIVRALLKRYDDVKAAFLAKLDAEREKICIIKAYIKRLEDSFRR